MAQLLIQLTGETMKIRNSKQREAILNVLSQRNYHPTADDIYVKVKKDFPKTSLATIYRNVEQLSRLGKIRRIETASGPARYDGNIEKHFHIKCSQCGQVRDVWLKEKLENYIDLDDAIKDYLLTGYDISFEGICNKCNGKMMNAE